MRISALICAGILLTSCSSLGPSNDGLIYQTTDRKQQGAMGKSARDRAAEGLLDSGVVRSPRPALNAALPDAEINLKRWGLTYFESNWNRYTAVLDADIRQDARRTKCRLQAPEDVEDAPTLAEITRNDGVMLSDLLDALIQQCVAKTLANAGD